MVFVSDSTGTRCTQYIQPLMYNYTLLHKIHYIHCDMSTHRQPQPTNSANYARSINNTSITGGICTCCASLQPRQ